MTKEEIKNLYSMRDILERCGFPQPNRAGFISCPFHKEKTASMKIYKDSYYCFGCGEHGDIFDFMRRVNNQTFKEAFESLGGTFGQGESCGFLLQRTKAIREQERREAKRKERDFKKWRREKLSEACNLLRLCDNADGLFEPFSDEWAYLIGLRQINEYKYQILGFGSREEQEEMRNHHV